MSLKSRDAPQTRSLTQIGSIISGLVPYNLNFSQHYEHSLQLLQDIMWAAHSEKINFSLPISYLCLILRNVF